MTAQLLDPETRVKELQRLYPQLPVSWYKV